MPKTLSAALIVRLDIPPENFPAGCNAHIFPDGAFHADDGRPARQTDGKLHNWQMNASVATALIAALDASGKPILYDYEHNSLYGNSRAAGWIDRLVYAPGSGLYAHVDWTPAAADAIAKKEYRYSSPYFYFDPDSGEIKSLESVGLTNNPALPDLSGVGLHKTPLSTAKESIMDEKAAAALNAALSTVTTERDALKTQLAALTTDHAALTAERDKLKTQVAAIDAEKAAAALASEKEKHAALLTAALTDGRLTPAQKPWAEKQSLAALTEYLEATTPLPITTPQSTGKLGPAVALTAEERAMCVRIGVTEETFVKTKIQSQSNKE